MGKEKFIEIIRNHQNLIYKICNSYCSIPENRKDLEQEILIQIWQSLKRYDGRVKLSTWIYKIALNTAITFYRDGSKHNNNRVKVDVSVLSLPDFEYDSETDKKISMLYGFIEKLNEIDKALMLLYLDDKKHKEIAEILGISETNVATKISRIKNAFKAQINNPKN